MSKFRTKLIGPMLVLAIGTSILLAGCGSGEVTTETYTDSEYGFSFDYPSDWEVASSTGAGVSAGAEPVSVVTVGDPHGAQADGTGVDLMRVQVYELNVSVDESLLPQAGAELENLVTSMQMQDPSMVIVQPLTQTELNGLMGYRFAHTFDWNADTPMRTASYFLFDGTTEYQLVVQSAEENWTANEEVFAAFFESFRAAGSSD